MCMASNARDRSFRRRPRSPRRRYLLLAAALFLLPGASCRNRAQLPPNIVLIVVDALRADSLSCYGYRRRTSPHIDAFAERNLFFSNAFSVGPNTTTSMAALMTGHLPFFYLPRLSCRGHPCQVHWNPATWWGLSRFAQWREVGLPARLATLAELVKENGYETAGYITNPYLKHGFHFDRGFAVYEELIPHDGRAIIPCETVTEHARAFLARRHAKPFFLYVHYMDVHAPYLPPAKYRNIFSYRRLPGYSDEELMRHRRKLAEKIAGDPERREAFRSHLKGLYDSAIVYVDGCIGDLLAAAQARGGEKRTVVVITADHGEEFLDHGRIEHSGQLYDEHLHVPLIMHIPSAGRGRIDALTRQFDLMPTILDLAGAPAPEDIDATSLMPVIEGRVKDRHEGMYAAFPSPNNRRMYRTSRYKLIDDSRGPLFSEFYDLAADPGEHKNLYGAATAAGALEAKLAAVTAKLAVEGRLRKPARRTPVAAVDAKTREQLRALGYMQSETPRP